MSFSTLSSSVPRTVCVRLILQCEHTTTFYLSLRDLELLSPPDYLEVDFWGGEFLDGTSICRSLFPTFSSDVLKVELLPMCHLNSKTPLTFPTDVIEGIKKWLSVCSLLVLWWGFLCFVLSGMLQVNLTLESIPPRILSSSYLYVKDCH